MPFRNPAIAGTVLTRAAIKNPTYQPGVRGWSINADGSAEFGNIIIRGGEVLITDPDGSYVRIYDENPGSGAVVELQPADLGGSTLSPGRLATESDPLFGNPSLNVVSPLVDGGDFAYVSVTAAAFGQGSVVTLGATNTVTVASDRLNLDGGYATNGDPGGYVGIPGYVTVGAVATSSGAEVAIPAGSWTAEPLFRFRNNRLYRIDVQHGLGITANVQIAPKVRLRKGSATTAGQLLGGTVLQPVPSNFAFHQSPGFTAFVKNVSGADIVTELSLTISDGTAGCNARLYGAVAPGPLLTVVCQNIGVVTESGGGAPRTHALSSLATAII